MPFTSQIEFFLSFNLISKHLFICKIYIAHYSQFNVLYCEGSYLYNVDISKAFNTINFDILLDNLTNYENYHTKVIKELFIEQEAIGFI